MCVSVRFCLNIHNTLVCLCRLDVFFKAPHLHWFHFCLFHFRCGALHAGNRLLSINGWSLENRSLPEAVQMLLKSDNVVRLEVITSGVTDVAEDDVLFDPALPSPPTELLRENSK